jgi:hypothetical protein
MRAYETIYCRCLAVLHFLIALGALLAGAALVVWPDALGAARSTTQLLAGAALYGPVGLTHLFAGYLSARREGGVEPVSMMAGLLLMVWLCAEVGLLRITHRLQPACLTLGVFLVLSSIWLWRTRHPPRSGESNRLLPF